MSFTTSRFARVDPSSERVKYSGNWSATHEMASGWTQSFHRLTGDGTLQFNFRGTKFALDGDAAGLNVSCSLNGVPFTQITEQENCGFNQNLPPNDYELLVRYQGKQFDLYSLNYQPEDVSDQRIAARTDFQSANLIMQGTVDKNITWSDGWAVEGEGRSTVHRAVKSGASVNITFMAVGLSVRATNPKELSIASAQSTYMLDGGEPVQFQLPTSKGLSLSLIDLEDLCYSPHILSIQYTADVSTAPLFIFNEFTAYFPPDVLNPPACKSSGPSPPIAQPSQTSIDTSSTSRTASEPARSVPAGTIAAAVVGAVLGLLILIGLVIFLRRRKRRLSSREEPVVMQQNADYLATPFRRSFPSLPASPSRKNLAGTPSTTLPSNETVPAPSPLVPEGSYLNSPLQHTDSGLRGNHIDEEVQPRSELPPVYTQH